MKNPLDPMGCWKNTGTIISETLNKKSTISECRDNSQNEKEKIGGNLLTKKKESILRIFSLQTNPSKCHNTDQNGCRLIFLIGIDMF
jgi:hypothetical protein